MNYATLLDMVIAFAHRPDLVANAPDFVRLAEGMIGRDLRAYPLSITLTEADRVADGLYELPDGLLEVRAVYNPDGCALEQVGLQQLPALASNDRTVWFAMHGRTRIEFRGAPGTDAELVLHYLGKPDALSITDTNALLDEHEALYLYGALFFLYQFTQDVELSQGALDTFRDTLDKLNESLGRTIGGASVARAYDFGCGGSY